MVQETYLLFKKFFNNITSFLDLNDFNDSVISEFNTFCMNSLNDIPYHSHKSLKCSYPNLTYYRSYPRSFIVYKDNTVVTHSLSIPVFYCKSCNHYHALLPAPFLIPHEQASIGFILCVLFDRFFNKMKVAEILEKFNLPQTTYYRWVNRYKMYYRIFITLFNGKSFSFFTMAEQHFTEMSQSFFYATGSSLFEKSFKLFSNTG